MFRPSLPHGHLLMLSRDVTSKLQNLEGLLLYWLLCCVLAVRGRNQILWDKLIFRHSGSWGQLLKSRFDCRACQRKHNNTTRCPICKKRIGWSDVAFKSFYELWSQLTISSFSPNAMVDLKTATFMSHWHCWSYSNILYPSNLLDEFKYSLKWILIIFLQLNCPCLDCRALIKKPQPYRASLLWPKFTLLGDDLLWVKSLLQQQRRKWGELV